MRWVLQHLLQYLRIFIEIIHEPLSLEKGTLAEDNSLQAQAYLCCSPSHAGLALNWTCELALAYSIGQEQFRCPSGACPQDEIKHEIMACSRRDQTWDQDTRMGQAGQCFFRWTEGHWGGSEATNCMDAVASQKEAVTDLVMDSVDFYLKWEWQFSRPRTQCGRMTGIFVRVWMLQIHVVCVHTQMQCVYTSLTEPPTRTHGFPHMRTRNLHAYTFRIVSVMINGHRVWIAHWRQHNSTWILMSWWKRSRGGGAHGLRVLVNSRTARLCVLSYQVEGFLHCGCVLCGGRVCAVVPKGGDTFFGEIPYKLWRIESGGRRIETLSLPCARPSCSPTKNPPPPRTTLRANWG